MAKSNPRYECSSPTCNAKNTRNQLKGSNGICLHCKTPMAHSSWLGGQQGTVFQLLTLPTREERIIKSLGAVLGMEPAELIAAAVLTKIKDWSLAEDIEKAVKQDLMLAKLYRR